MRLTKEEVRHIALLARLGLSDSDVEKFQVQLSNILENFEVLKQVDTTNVPPTAQPIEMSNVLRDDRIAPSCSQQEVLANAPNKEEDYFKVKAVLE
jgi:aspartyl-tRNA(Asn)/glutamyl-tRNA(Gln) amidotransferase subunit C